MKSKTIIRILTVLCFIAVIGLSIYVGDQKEDFFTDEYYSYGCANSNKDIEPEKGVPYADSQQLFTNAFAAQPGSWFSFDLAWKNASANVHPPLYFAALHFVCSLIPGVFSKWFAIGLNIVFALLTLYFYRKILKNFFSSSWMVLALTAGYAAMLGIYANVVFLRMYVMAMMALSIVTWELLQLYHDSKGWKPWVKAGCASVLAALTHYYCLIYLFFICGTLCVLWMLKKNWRSILIFFGTELAAGGAAYAIFPYILIKLLYSHRGTEAQKNLTGSSIEKTLQGYQYFYNEVNTKIFGGLLPWILLAAVLIGAAAIILWRMKKLPVQASDAVPVPWADAVLAAAPAIMYFVVVAKIAAYQNVRYMYPVFPQLALAMILLWIICLRRLVKRNALLVLMAVAVLIVGGLTWNSGSIMYMYRGTDKKIARAVGEYRGTDAVVFWRGYRGKGNTLYPQIDYYGNITYYFKPSEKRVTEVRERYGDEGKDFIVLVDNDCANYVDLLLAELNGYTATELPINGTGSKFTNYYFHREGT